MPTYTCCVVTARKGVPAEAKRHAQEEYDLQVKSGSVLAASLLKSSPGGARLLPPPHTHTPTHITSPCSDLDHSLAFD